MAVGNRMGVLINAERVALYYDLGARLEIEAGVHSYEVRIILPCRQNAR